MFIGEYRHTVDAKNRVAVPIKFRDTLKPGAVITKGLDECLFLYPKAEWEAWAQKISKLPVSQSKTRAFLRIMLAGAMEVDLDKQGRVVIPDYLKEYAHLQKQVVVAGLYDRLELWDDERWQQFKKRSEKESDQIAETLGTMGV